MHVKTNQIAYIGLILVANINHCIPELEKIAKYRFELYSLGGDSLGVSELSSAEIQKIIGSGKATVHQYKFYNEENVGEGSGDDEAQLLQTIKDQIEPLISEITHNTRGVSRLNPFILNHLIPDETRSDDIARIGTVDEVDGTFRVQVTKTSILGNEDDDSLPIFAMHACSINGSGQYIGKSEEDFILSPIELAYEIPFLRSKHKADLDSGKIYKKIFCQSRGSTADIATYFGHANSIAKLQIPHIISELTTTYEWINFIGLDWYKSDRMSDLYMPCYAIEIRNLDGSCLYHEFETDDR